MAILYTTGVDSRGRRVMLHRTDNGRLVLLAEDETNVVTNGLAPHEAINLAYALLHGVQLAPPPTKEGSA